MVILLLVACATEPLTLESTAGPDGLHVRASAAVERVEVVDAEGIPVTTLRLPTPAVEVDVTAPLSPGTYRVRARAGESVAEVSVEVAAPPPVRFEVIAAPGQPWTPAPAELRVREGVEILLGVTPGPGFPPEVVWSEGPPIPLRAPGERVVRALRPAPGTTVIHLGDTSIRITTEAVDASGLRAAVSLGGLVFPAELSGEADLGRAPWRITLPTAWWAAATRALGLGGRAADAWAPWARVGMELANTSDTPVDVSVSAVVLQDGEPAPAFRPRVREGDGGTGVVTALVRVPAGGNARPVLPVFVDPAVVRPGAYTLVVTATPLGGETPLWREEAPLYVRAGDPVAGLGFAGMVLASAAGLGWTTARVRGWLERAATSELLTIALFGCALFVVGSASDLVSMAVGAVLGPFSTLLTGILQDASRVALLATLLTLLPRPGTLALATLTGWIGRSLTTGGFSPTDVLYTGAAIALQEGFAWLAGLTRGVGWREEPGWRRWCRLSLAFGGANMLTTLCGLWMHVVLFRMFFADWYIALQAIGPGFLYVLAACALAVPFAESLRRVEA